MKKDEWTLSKELGRLRKYGINLNAERVEENECYNIVFEKSRKILEPSCTVQEILGITHVLEWYIEYVIAYNKRMKNEGTQ